MDIDLPEQCEEKPAGKQIGKPTREGFRGSGSGIFFAAAGNRERKKDTFFCEST
jgi:hypothetical protein